MPKAEYRVEFKTEKSFLTPEGWNLRAAYRAPTGANVEENIKVLVDSYGPGGVNASAGKIVGTILKARLVRLSDGLVVAEWDVVRNPDVLIVDRWDEDRQEWRHWKTEKLAGSDRYVVTGEVDSLGLPIHPKGDLNDSRSA